MLYYFIFHFIVQCQHCIPRVAPIHTLSKVKYVWAITFSLKRLTRFDDDTEQNVKSQTVNIIWFFRLFFLFIRSKRFAHSSREHLSSLCSQSRRAIAQKCFLPPLKDWDATASKVNWALLRLRPFWYSGWLSAGGRCTIIRVSL